RQTVRRPLALRTCTVPAKPRWLLSIPDAISQLESVDRTLLTRRDIERLFGVSIGRGRRARAPTSNCSTAFFAPSTAGERW
ncbi:MAG: hypothetical protein OXG35_07485, partial [Acidobacteria bacterium]|nr:hypothetical protein [Acidobacteriota bacterium]